ncbi:hypothetical protein H2199_005994 [Coniosporium tulheliwenetii]|uniref:Uncharacterized protein n=1 Tax=Coniosporium tulheliwenetii TaxID=3383036 RepID=A0ACC2YZG2_9PEZI|nr:hypothetical protein H2199_005994 [Cladosporium sp. JES 115]
MGEGGGSNRRRGNQSANLVTLELSNRNRWHKAHFALKPLSVSQDRKSLKVQLFWQADYDENEPVPADLKPRSSKGANEFVTRYGAPSWIYEPGSTLTKRVESGYEFDITTADPVEMPLPNFNLMQLAFLMARVVALRGDVDDSLLVD